jgi:Flp pilus assembly protein TadG
MPRLHQSTARPWLALTITYNSNSTITYNSNSTITYNNSNSTITYNSNITITYNSNRTIIYNSNSTITYNSNSTVTVTVTSLSHQRSDVQNLTVQHIVIALFASPLVACTPGCRTLSGKIWRQKCRLCRDRNRQF